MKKPQYKDYRGHPIDGLHHAMRDWANSQSKPDLIVEIVFNDGSFYTDRFPPAQREELYWCGHDNNGYYSVNVDVGNKWYWCGEVLGIAEIRKLELESAERFGFKSFKVFKEKVDIEPKPKPKPKGKVYYHEVSMGEG